MSKLGRPLVYRLLHNLLRLLHDRLAMARGVSGLLSIFHPDCRPVVLKGRPLERVETLLAWSEASKNWEILSDDPNQMNDTPIIPLGPKGSFDS